MKMKRLTFKVIYSVILFHLLIIVTGVGTQETALSRDRISTEPNQIQRILHEENEEHHDEENHEELDHEDVHVEDRGSDYRTWLHASLALFVISLCGVFGVIIIPIMQKIFYQHLLQFLIALGE